jgi:hypothetical protein
MFLYNWFFRQLPKEEQKIKTDASRALISDLVTFHTKTGLGAKAERSYGAEEQKRVEKWFQEVTSDWKTNAILLQDKEIRDQCKKYNVAIDKAPTRKAMKGEIRNFLTYLMGRRDYINVDKRFKAALKKRMRVFICDYAFGEFVSFYSPLLGEACELIVPISEDDDEEPLYSPKRWVYTLQQDKVLDKMRALTTKVGITRGKENKMKIILELFELVKENKSWLYERAPPLKRTIRDKIIEFVKDEGQVQLISMYPALVDEPWPYPEYSGGIVTPF